MAKKIEEDLGVVPDTEDLGVVPDNDVNDFEIQMVTEKQQAESQIQAAAAQEQAAREADADPKNWTLERTKKHFKDNPPKTLQEEAFAKQLMDEKKAAIKEVTDKINGEYVEEIPVSNNPEEWTYEQAKEQLKLNPPKTVQDEAEQKVFLEKKKAEFKDEGVSAIAHFTRSIMKHTPIEQVKTLVWASKNLDKLPKPVEGESFWDWKNRAIREAGQDREQEIEKSGTIQQLGDVMTAGVGAAALSAPISTAAMLGIFTVIEHIADQAGVNDMIKKIPNPTARDVADIVKFGAEGMLAGGGARKGVESFKEWRSNNGIGEIPKEVNKIREAQWTEQQKKMQENREKFVPGETPYSATEPGGVKASLELESPPVVLTPSKESEVADVTKMSEKATRAQINGIVEPSPEVSGFNERKFAKTLRESDTTAPEVKAEFPEGKYNYQPITHKQTLAEARDLIARDRESVISEIDSTVRPTRVSNAAGELLIVEAQEAGRFSDAIRIAKRLTEKNTEMGQAINALGIWRRLSPEGILRYAQKELDVAGVKIDPKFGEEIVGRAKKMQEMPDGREKDIETALILKDIANKVPANALQKVSIVQTMAQLLNPKTFVRNILGNLGLVVTENIAGSIGTAIDVAASLRTGKRTQYLPSLKTQAKGLVQGAKEGTQEAMLGIDLKPNRNKFDLPRNGVFNEGVMGGLEKALSVSLGAADRAFYQAAFNDSLRMQARAAKVSEPTAEMIEKAHFDGLYRTFQDENAISRLFVGLKKALNAGKDWGLGDMVLKYPKTPANLLARGIEYSPFGFAQSVMKIAAPLFVPNKHSFKLIPENHGLGQPFDQAGFVKSTSRALVGSSLLVGTGAILAEMGIITGKRQKDKDIAATQQNVGIRDYQINIDALKRFVASGLDPDQAKIQEGDTLVTYDWMQPSSIGLALGANMVLSSDQSAADKIVNMADRIFEASETLASQPLVQGLKKITGYGSISEGVAQTVQGIPASFVPTILNQVRQLMDNTARNTKTPNWYEEAYTQAVAKIPGVSGQLPARINSLGKQQEMYQAGTNNPFNVFLNPMFVSKYKPDKVSEMVLGIWERSGQSVQFPRISGSTIKVGVDQIEMTPEQYGEFQAYIGEKTNKLFSILADNERFMSFPDDQKAKLLQGYLTDINTGAKIEILGYRPKRYSQDMIDIMRSISLDHKQIKENEADDLVVEDNE